MLVHEAAAAPGTPRLLLDVRPFLERTSLQVTIDGAESRVRLIRYSNERLLVFEVRAGVLASPRAASLAAAVADARKVPITACRDSLGEGIRRGDQFRLRVLSAEGSIHECVGFVPDAPVPVRKLIDMLVALGPELAPATIATGYILGRDVEDARAERPEQGSTRDVRDLASLPAVIRPALHAAAGSPYEMIALEATVHGSILNAFRKESVTSVSIDGRFFEIVVFRGASNPDPAHGGT